MKFILTGGAGQIASALSSSLSIGGHEVIAPPKSYFDISNEKQVKSLFEDNAFDMVINCAAVAGVELCEQYPDLAEKVNAKALKYLGYYAKKYSKPLLHLSTNCIFDGQKTTPYLETDHPNPRSVYGITKLEGELILFEEAKNVSVILRLGRVFSEYQGCNFFIKILQLLKEQGSVKIVNDQFGSPTSAHHISTVIEMMARKMKCEKGLGEIYHYCDVPDIDWYSFSDYFIKIAQDIGLLTADIQYFPISSLEYDPLGKYPTNGILNCTKICKFLNFSQYQWTDGLYSILKNIYMKNLLENPRNLNTTFDKRTILSKSQLVIS